MARWKPDPTFYPSPALASEAPAERLAYVALLASAESGRRDALGVVDTDPSSTSYGRQVGQVDLPDGGNELRPAITLPRQLLLPGGGEPIELRLLIGVGLTPVRLDPPLPLEPMQGWIQRAGLHLQRL